MNTFAIVTRTGLAQEDSIEREFWQGAYIAAIGNGLGAVDCVDAADIALEHLRQRRADMSAAEPVSS